MEFLTTILQVLGLVGLSLSGNWIARLLHINFPGSIIGILLLFLILKMNLIQIKWVEKGSDFLIKHLMLFFVPSAVGIMEYKQIVITEGVRFELVILLGTLTVMICTGKITDYVGKYIKDKG